MTSKEAIKELKRTHLAKVILEPIEKDLDKLEHIKALVEKYNNDEMHFTRGFDFINIVKEVLKDE